MLRPAFFRRDVAVGNRIEQGVKLSPVADKSSKVLPERAEGRLEPASHPKVSSADFDEAPAAHRLEGIIP